MMIDNCRWRLVFSAQCSEHRFLSVTSRIEMSTSNSISQTPPPRFHIHCDATSNRDYDEYLKARQEGKDSLLGTRYSTPGIPYDTVYPDFFSASQTRLKYCIELNEGFT